MSNYQYFEKFNATLNSNALKIEIGERKNLFKLFKNILKICYKKLINIYIVISHEKFMPSIKSKINKSSVQYSLRDKLKIKIIYFLNILKLKK